jgi:hypothetical protein
MPLLETKQKYGNQCFERRKQTNVENDAKFFCHAKRNRMKHLLPNNNILLIMDIMYQISYDW